MFGTLAIAANPGPRTLVSRTGVLQGGAQLGDRVRWHAAEGAAGQGNCVDGMLSVVVEDLSLTSRLERTTIVSGVI